MKISVNYEDGQIFQHFGRTTTFKIYEVENGVVLRSYLLPADGAGHGTLATQLASLGVNVAICGGLGMGMLNALRNFGIQVCANVTGSADEAVAAYLSNALTYSQEAHACGGHHHHHNPYDLG